MAKFIRSFLGECVRTAYITIGMAKRGGARPNAGRKRNEDKIRQEQRDAVERMLVSRQSLLSELHDPVIMKLFKAAILEGLQSKNAQERSRAMVLMAKVLLENPLPKPAENEDTKLDIAELLKIYEEKRQEEDENGPVSDGFGDLDAGEALRSLYSDESEGDSEPNI